MFVLILLRLASPTTVAKFSSSRFSVNERFDFAQSNEYPKTLCKNGPKNSRLETTGKPRNEKKKTHTQLKHPDKPNAAPEQTIYFLKFPPLLLISQNSIYSIFSAKLV